ncbi:MAG: hypothetical protein K0S44_222 [Bacteroidetes bacterium]|jgi:capsid protein|nr:hypothetical protein [Bacteroidota bacterium]
MAGSKLWDVLKSSFGKKQTPAPAPKAEYDIGSYRTLFTVSYNGEKNLGEIGPIKDYRPDYDALRLRSWQSFYESEITQIVMKRFGTWVIGKGLKLQSEPVEYLLKQEGINLKSQTFAEAVEARFNIYKKSKVADFAKMKSLDMIAKVAHKNAILGGDVLVVLRFDGKNVNVQLIDGAHIQSPLMGTEWYPQELSNGNRIINGIEMTPQGEHVRYYVRNKDYSYTKIEAKGSESGLQQAFLVYGMEYRLDNVRGLPLIAAVLETIKKMERYKEATVGSAEERQKIAFSIEHGAISTEENPFAEAIADASGFSSDDDIPETDDGEPLRKKVAVTTNKQVVNMPKGATLKLLESKNELYFKDFYTVNIDMVCATLGIPPDVAKSKYDSNFSASRAALKDWEHTLNVLREEFSFAFYQPIYNFWLEVQILQNKISAPGYLSARAKGDDIILEAYRSARFVGATVPHIDPLKEVEAERRKLGTNADHIPLTTVESATENLNSGESDENMKQFALEFEEAKKLNLIPQVAKPSDV